MPRKPTKPTAKGRRTAVEPSELLPSTELSAEVVVLDDGASASCVVPSGPAPAVAGANLAAEDRGPTGGLSASAVGHRPSPEAKPSHYEFVHAAVGGHYKGERVVAGTFTDEQTWRLLTAGAIIPYTWRSEPCN